MNLELALWGFFWGGISAVSLPLGAILGLWSKPKRKVVSSLMAFGGGALLFALTIELFGHALHESSDAHGNITDPSLILATMLGALLGGLLFQGLNSILNQNGAHVSKRALLRRHIVRSKRRRAGTLIKAFFKSQGLDIFSAAECANPVIFRHAYFLLVSLLPLIIMLADSPD